MRSQLFLLTLLAGAAFAHTNLKEAIPAADSTVAAPTNVILHFSGDLEPKFSQITVTDATGHVVNKESSTVGPDTKSMSVTLPATLKPGVYMVNWVGVSVDTHRSTGDYKFTVK